MANLRLEKLLDNISWIVGDSDVATVRYSFDKLLEKQNLLRATPYEDPDEEVYGDDTDTSVSAIHPVINTMLSEPIQGLRQPFVLYLISNEDEDEERLEYDTVRSGFDVLGAINTYYNEKTQGDPSLILGDHVYFEGITPTKDGYTVHFGS